MGMLKVFMKEKDKKELLEDLKLLQEGIAVSEVEENKIEKEKKRKIRFFKKK
jgi:hypothetical protein